MITRITEATIFGVGGCGGNVVQYVQQHCSSRLQYIYMDSEGSAIDRRPSEGKQIQIPRSPPYSKSSQKWVNAADECAPAVNKILLTTKILFIVTGLSGKAGTDAMPVVARAAKKMNLLTIGIAVMPFDFEGETRIWRAKTMLAALRVNVSKLLVFHNEDLLAQLDSDAMQDTAFAFMNENILQTIESWLPEVRGTPSRSSCKTNPTYSHLPFSEEYREI
jgi:cell division protein FtsZ